MEEFDLKRSLLLGSTLGGICSDGVIPGHPWGNWIAQRRMREAEAFRLADHWEKWRKDDMLLHSMGLECCRFVLDWARLQPEQKGFDDEAIAHVREEILYLRAMGVRVALVLQECCDPAWFQRLGGWAKAENVHYFLRYVEKIVRTVGHLVEDYVPVGQPNLYAWNGWYSGMWPPGLKSLRQTRQVMGTLVAAHIESYNLIHELREEFGLQGTRVGASIHMRMMRGKNKTPLGLIETGTVDKLFQIAMGEAMTCGKFPYPLPNYLHAKKGVYCDFHDLCCYSLPAAHAGSPVVPREPDANELLYCAATRSAMLRKPIFITEGPGLSAPSPQRIYEIVRALSGAGLPVERWHALPFADGALPGLVAIEPETGARKLRPAGEFLSRMIRNRGVTADMCRDYGAGEE